MQHQISQDLHPETTPAGHTIKLLTDVTTAVEYAALSYCWGSSPGLVTDSYNIEAHKEGLKVKSMPKTFQDAVAVAQGLGLAHLWIDALCIIQDSHADWVEQSAQMIQVYSEAEIVIGALASAAADHGFLGPRSLPQDSTLDVLSHAGSISTSVHYRHIRRASHFGAVGPLEDRAWALQERLVARRFLAYGQNELAWDCREADACECNCVLFRARPFTYISNIDRLLSQAGTPELNNAWRRVILRNYCARELTYPSDVLVALSGVAAVFHTKRPGRYLAGLWESSLVLDLTWQMRGTAQDFPMPTWSWASVNNASSLYYTFMGTHGDYTASTEVARVIDAGVQVVSATNPYGAVTGGFVTLRGHFVRVQLESHDHEDSTPAAHPSQGESEQKLSFSMPGILQFHDAVCIGPNIDVPLVKTELVAPDGKRLTTARRLASGQPNTMWNAHNDKPAEAWLLILVSSTTWRGGRDSGLDGLLLVPVDSAQNEFNRIGTCSLRCNDGAQLVKKMDLKQFRIT
jgi:hypothetical protein